MICGERKSRRGRGSLEEEEEEDEDEMDCCQQFPALISSLAASGLDCPLNTGSFRHAHLRARLPCSDSSDLTFFHNIRYKRKAIGYHIISAELLRSFSLNTP